MAGDHTFSVRSFVRALALSAGLFASLGSAESATNQPGTVYLIMGSDTAIWNAGSTVDVYSHHPHYPQNFFTDPSSPAFKVMDPAWRSKFRDSFDQQVKFTWWLMGGNIFRDADNINVPIANTMVPYLMKTYHGDAIRSFGDELSLHYHTFLWSDYVGEGLYVWNQSRTFEECRTDFDYTLAQYLLEEDIFPVSFRSGWHYMDNDWQHYLDELIPYSMHNNWPTYIPWYQVEPIGNVQNWGWAPSDFVPYHPATTNYQVPGNCPGWELRSIKMQAMAQRDMSQLFAQASNGVDQVACIWSHLPEAFVSNFERIHSYAHVAASNYPSVKFRYCTAVEAMQRWRGVFGEELPDLTVEEILQNKLLTLQIRSSKTLFQPRPFVAVRDAFQNFSNPTDHCIPTGSNQWSITIPIPANRLAKVGIAATDLAGNLVTRLFRYLPDDLYLDNLDPNYTELQGNWSYTTNSAWGTNARIATLTSIASPAHVRWRIPISKPGFYSLSVQVPPVDTPADNYHFSLWSGDTQISLAQIALPAAQWICLGGAWLEPSASNYLDMTVSGQPGTKAVANVIRVIPLFEPPQNSLSAQLTANGVQLRYSGMPGSAVWLESSPNLLSWEPVCQMTVSALGCADYSITNQFAALFYRVRN